jgi:hypothetical protein
LARSCFPGIGTAVGAGIWRGRRVDRRLDRQERSGEKLNDARRRVHRTVRRHRHWCGFWLRRIGLRLSGARRLGLHGKKLFDDVFKADNFDDFNAAVKKMVDALGSGPTPRSRCRNRSMHCKRHSSN